jgi:succinyl-CoA synthetase beta subunit
LKLFEHEAKDLFSEYGIPTPRRRLVNSSEQARKAAADLGGAVAVKAQVLVGGRGKAGGILFADSPAKAQQIAGKLLKMRIKGIPVQSLLVEERVEIKKELYLGLTVDRSNRTYVAIASSEGGMEIEEVAASMPEKIVKIFVDPMYGVRPYHARQIAKRLGYIGRQMLDLATIFVKLYRMAMDYDAELTEINPLVENPEGRFIAADARLTIDDSALYRHATLKERALRVDEGDLLPREMQARKNGLAYVKLEGDVGVIGNGAGLVMATLDAIQLHGGSPANFLDVGGGASADRMAAALDIVFSDPGVKVVFINILGGITRCDEIARGILDVKRQMGFVKPMIIRLVGTNEEEGRRILTDAGIPVLDSMEQAAKRVVEIIKGEG